MVRSRLALATLALTGLTLIAINRPAICQAGQDVPRDHWAYEAVNDLISKGLVKGFPPDGLFRGKRTATRYELATIIKRALDYVDDKLAKNKVDVSSFVKQEQLDELRKLVSDFKMELAVIGTDLQKVKDQIGDINAKVEEHGKRLDALGKAVEQAQAEAKAARD